jgi:hypothetical protein
VQSADEDIADDLEDGDLTFSQQIHAMVAADKDSFDTKIRALAKFLYDHDDQSMFTVGVVRTLLNDKSQSMTIVAENDSGDYNFFTREEATRIPKPAT